MRCRPTAKAKRYKRIRAVVEVGAVCRAMYDVRQARRYARAKRAFGFWHVKVDTPTEAL